MCIVLPTQAGVEVGDCLVEVCGEAVYQMQHQKVQQRPLYPSFWEFWFPPQLKQKLLTRQVDTTDIVVVKVSYKDRSRESFTSYNGYLSSEVTSRWLPVLPSLLT